MNLEKIQKLVDLEVDLFFKRSKDLIARTPDAVIFFGLLNELVAELNSKIQSESSDLSDEEKSLVLILATGTFQSKVVAVFK